MSPRQNRRNSLEDSSSSTASSFDSDEQLSDLEESDSHQARKKEKKIWTMRSGPTRNRSDSQSYAPVNDDDQYGPDGSSADEQYDDDGSRGYGDDSYSKAERGNGGTAKQTQGDYAPDSTENEAQDYDGEDRSAGTDDMKEKRKSRKKTWLWVGLAGIILLLLLLGIYFLWLRSKPEESDSSPNSSSMTSSQSPSLSSTSAPNTTSAATSLATAHDASNATSSTSLTDSPVSSPHVNPKPAPSTTQPTTTTSTAANAATTYFAQITWFNDEDIVTPCGSNPNDGDYFVRVSKELYGATDTVSPLCGKWISLYQLETDSYTKATIEGICSDCKGNNIDLSRATFWALTQDMKLGTTLAQWWWTAKEDQPQNTLESQVPVVLATEGASSRPKVSLADSGSEAVTAKPAVGSNTLELTP